MRIVYTACTACGHNFFRGLRRFGPAQVQCGHCKHVMRTGLRDWAQASTARKVWWGFLEVFFPSHFRGRDLASLAILYFVTLLLASSPMILLGIVVRLALENPAAFAKDFYGDFIAGGTFIPFLMLLGYEAFIILRLRGMIRQNLAYNQNNVPPVWG